MQQNPEQPNVVWSPVQDGLSFCVLPSVSEDVPNGGNIVREVVRLFPDDVTPGHHTFFVWRDANHLAQWLAMRDDTIKVHRVPSVPLAALFPTVADIDTVCLASLAFDTPEGHYRIVHSVSFAEVLI